MKIEIEISEQDIRNAVFERLKGKFPHEVTEFFGSNPIQVKMTLNSREGWRRPRYLRILIEKEINLP